MFNVVKNKTKLLHYWFYMCFTKNSRFAIKYDLIMMLQNLKLRKPVLYPSTKDNY